MDQSAGINAGGVVVLVTIAKGAVTNNDPADVITAGTGDDTLGGNAKATLRFDVVPAADDTDESKTIAWFPLRICRVL